MRRKKLFFPVFLCLCHLIFFHSCTTTTRENFEEPIIQGDEASIIQGDIVEATGIIKYVDLEGGFYGIIADDKHYVPVNLSKEFEMDGLKVKFKAKIRKDLVSIHMWGILIELTHINKIK
ncbi:hypothetical protein ES703_10784 [subsurface metagenome]